MSPPVQKCIRLLKAPFDDGSKKFPAGKKLPLIICVIAVAAISLVAGYFYSTSGLPRPICLLS
jgi:hypothetical protein